MIIRRSRFLIFILAAISINFCAWGGVPDQVYAPYVDICSTPTFSIGSMCDEIDTFYYTLAFVVPGYSAQDIATWGGYHPMSLNWYLDEVQYIRGKGGDVIISFGGATARELAREITDVADLVVQYQSVIDTYNISHIDFDIEGAALYDTPANTRRNQAIKLLQDANPDLKVGYCFPVTPDYGITAPAFAILSDAIANNARVDVVNCMAMDYGAWYDSQPEYQDQGTNAILSAQMTYHQLETLYPSKTHDELMSMLGVTQMIGWNDDTDEVFYLDDATQLLGFAQDSDIQMLGIWSANRDNGGCPNFSDYATQSCSGLDQELYAFSNIFKEFSGVTPVTPTPESTGSPAPTVTPTPNITSTPTATPTSSVIPESSSIPTPKIVTTPTITPHNSPVSSAPRWIYDYNGDGTSDIAVFRESSGLWAIRNLTRLYFGSSGDLPVPGDYNGNGTTDIGIFRDSSGLWAIRAITRAYFGRAGDLPESGDYNGDGTSKLGLYRPSSGLWAIKGVTRIYFGGIDDTPVPGYYQGDSTKVIGIFRGESGLWAIRNMTRIYYGSTMDTTTPGDYDGDGSWDFAIFRGSAGLWAIRGLTRIYFGSDLDQPVPADYTGDSRVDVGVFRETTGLWGIKGLTRIYFGRPQDVPVIR